MKNDEKETLDLNLIIIALDVVTYANFCHVVGGIGLSIMKEKPRLIHLIREQTLLMWCFYDDDRNTTSFKNALTQ